MMPRLFHEDFYYRPVHSSSLSNLGAVGIQEEDPIRYRCFHEPLKANVQTIGEIWKKHRDNGKPTPRRYVYHRRMKMHNIQCEIQSCRKELKTYSNRQRFCRSCAKAMSKIRAEQYAKQKGDRENLRKGYEIWIRNNAGI